MNFILAQIIGIAVTIYAAIGTQLRSIKAVLMMEIITNLMTALTYVLLGSYSGMWVCIVAMVQGMVMNHLNAKAQEKNCDRKRILLMVLFGVIFIAGSIVTYERPKDVFPCICALIYTVSLCQKDVLKYKMISIFNPFFWIFYDFATGAYTTILTRLMLIVLTAIGILRMTRQRREAKGERRK